MGPLLKRCKPPATTSSSPITVRRWRALNSTFYAFEVVVDSSTDADPVYDPATRVNDEDTWMPDLTSTHTLHGPDASQSTQLVRNGKSPNIFATDVKASSETWSNNSVDYMIDGTVTTTFAYHCDVTKYEWTDPVGPTPPSGANYDYEHKDNPGQNLCDKYDGTRYWGETHGNCVLVGVTYDDEGDEGSPGFFTDVPIGPVGDFTVDQTSESETYGPFTDLNAGSHTYYDTGALGQAVVCISPGPKGGTWRTQNMYTGVAPQLPCTTATFLSLAPNTGIPSNSLPVN